MFIEKITDEQIVNFFSKYKVGVYTIERNADHIYTELSVDSYGPQPEFALTDFDVKELNTTIRQSTIGANWRKYLYGIYGEDYKKALISYLDNNKKDILNSLN